MTKWIACLGLVAFLGGCDQSKEELESTKTQLTSVSKERDDLKKQVASLQKDLEAAKSAVAEAKLPATATNTTAVKGNGKDAKDAKPAATPAPAAKAKDAHK